ncbi:hypothetical protein [Flaviaesturariibacter amylovorans]|uniref:YqaE/Pmp3 family membrane protein n=1 Tax=Flaviaesturariibacter amylovorans TaxID=1084520 RepID=A0ABP8GAS0_9BACT
MPKHEKHKRAFLVWLAIYPLITFLLFALGGVLQRMPLLLRTFVLTIIAVPTVFYVILPLYQRWFRNWLEK